MPNIKCGHCGNYHETIDAVKRCGRGESPATTTAANVVLATERQVEYLLSLQLKLPTEQHQDRMALEGLSKQQASSMIERLIKMPKPKTEDIVDVMTGKPSDTAADTVPAGRYAVQGYDGTWRFYKVDKPTEGRWAGRTFVSIQASDELHSVKNPTQRAAVITAILERGIERSMTDYGKQIGRCGHCNRTLTDPDSIARGIGPICYGKMGF